MPTDIKTAKPTAARTTGSLGGRPAAPADAVRPTVTVPPLPAAAPDTPAARALWTALHAHPDATSADLATAAGIGRSTATALLAGLARSGLVSRTVGGGQGRTRQPDRWAPGAAPTADPPLQPVTVTPAPVAVPPSTRDGAETGAIAPPTGKLAGGQLRDLVAAHLHAHPEQEFGPASIAKALHRSAGAVANACIRLTVLGRATQTCVNPRRYRARKTR